MSTTAKQIEKKVADLIEAIQKYQEGHEDHPHNALAAAAVRQIEGVEGFLSADVLARAQEAAS